ncbi:MAG: amino acid adenylation domain-containing protein, partial [Thermoanaerobaculia bacterium]|nr:amino acid adenylation domain-containing protein [Thermoanaerobaculia bacterium]
EGVREPAQVIGRRVALPWRREDGSGLDADEQARRLAALEYELSRQLGQLGRAPLLRLALIETGPREFRFLFCHHHLILDGWSLPLLLAEVFGRYLAHRNGTTFTPAPAAPFRTYIAWARQRDRAAAEVYWRQVLAGFTAGVVPGFDRGRPGDPVRRDDHCNLRLDGADAAQIQSFARAHGLTPSTVFQGAWGLALGRISGRTDVVYGASLAGRPPELGGIETALGPYTNTLPVRLALTSESVVLPWLLALQSALAELRGHEHDRLTEVQKWSDVAAGQPLFESVLVFENYPLGQGLGALGDVELTDLQASLRTSVPLLPSVKPTAAGFELSLAFDADRFGPGEAEDTLRLWARLATELVADPRRRLGALPGATAAELRCRFERGNDTARPDLDPTPVHLAIAARAAAWPRRPALLHGARTVDYGALLAFAQGVADGLSSATARAAGGEFVVGLLVPRGPEAIGSLLGILAAGGAYLPLDPRWPRERIAEVLADVGAIAVVIGEEFAASVPPELPAVVLETVLPTPPRAWPACHRARLAYLISTSGSTGRPKAVAVPHGALANYCHGAVEAYELTGDDRAYQFAALSFDASAEEIYPTLLAGATLVLRESDTVPVPTSFLTTLAAARVTVLNLPTAYFHELAHELDADSGGATLPECLRLTILGGERALPEPVRRWAVRAPAASRLVNTYGPTEATIVATRADVAERFRHGPQADTVPIGGPVANLRVLDLDRDFHPVPFGAPGELCLAGEGLARGYFGRPGRTAAAFVPDPSGNTPGARIYRTGDLVRHGPEGELRFLGRLDGQVKVRGFRIELGEIEAALRALPGVAQAAVVTPEDNDGRRRLVAFVTPTTCDIGALRAALVARLPEYMVPGRLTALPSLPLTSSGKVDARTLLAMAATTSDALPEAGDDSPRTAREETLATIWREVLGHAHIGIHQSFFELGGDSISSLQVVARARRAGLSISPEKIFALRTVAALAAEDLEPALVAPKAIAGPGPVPLGPAARRFFAGEPPKPDHFNQAALFVPAEALDVTRLRSAVARAAAFHDALHFVYRCNTEGWRAEDPGTRDGVVTSEIELAPGDGEGFAPALAAAIGSAQRSLDLASGRLGTVVLLRSAQGDRLLVVLHHLAVDVVSWPVFLADLEAAYRGETPPSEELPGASFADWSRQRAAGLETATSTEDGAGDLEDDRLPVDVPGAEDLVAGTRTHWLELDAAASSAFLAAGRLGDAGRGPLVFLLAALATVLGRWTGRERVAIELEGHGREASGDLDVSRTVGWFTAFRPVALSLGSAPTPAGALATAQQAIASSSRTFARAPEVVLNYLGTLDTQSAGPSAGSSWLVPAPEPVADTVAPEQRRWHAFEVNAAVRDGRLHLAWSHGARHHAATVERLAADLLTTLRALVDWAREVPGGLADLYPLAPMQRGLLFHVQLEGGAATYLSQSACELTGPLDRVALRRAWDAVTRRHPALRTSFHWRGLDEPLQCVHREVALDWREDATDAPLADLLAADRALGFALDRPPLHRLTLVQRAPERHALVWSIHHLLIDGWSQSVVLGEVLAAYDQARRGPTPELPAGPAYRNYVAWVLERPLAAAEAHWRQRLHGFANPTPLPAAGSREANGYAALGRRLDAPTTAALTAFARQLEVTLGTVLAGLWALLLARRTGESDVVFGATVSGRSAPLAEIEGAVGLFLNTLPVRLTVPPEARWGDWLDEIQRRQVADRAFESTPLVEIQGWSEIPRGQPLFETLVVVENFPASLGGGATGDDHVVLSGFRNYDRVTYPLTFQAIPGDELVLRLKYDRARLADDALETLFDQLETLCQQAPEDRDRPLAAFSLVTPGTPLPDPRTVLAMPRFPSVAAWVHERALAAPSAPALEHGDTTWSYCELWDRVATLAGHLVADGLVAGETVAVAGERSLDLIAAALAVLAAGGVLLTLDPALPAERRRMMIREAAARRRLVAGPDDLPGEGVAYSLDTIGPATEGFVPGPAPEHAYVFFTSGTTAVPRAVLGRHAGLSHFIAWQRETFELGAGDRVAQVTGLSFDVVLREIFLPLTSGATLVLPPPALAPEEALPWLAEAAITRLHTVPTLAQAWLEAAPPEVLVPSLVTVFFAGEPLTDVLVSRFRARAGEATEIVNLYGPTETTLAKCYHRVGDLTPGIQAVGRPLPETQALVLGPGDRLCGLGEPGEIVLRTPFRTAGYRNAPDENTRRFVANPFRDDPTDLLYRTGDRGRYGPRGELEILGRVDEEVKIRGVRVDPNEVAAVLTHQAEVAAAVVVAAMSPAGEKTLVAYVVPRSTAFSSRDMLAKAARELPTALVPGAVVTLAELPRTANGKVDRRALPAPAWDEVARSAGEPPRTPHEELLAAIWCEVLQRPRVQRDDHFFELGGHSLRATQVVARVRRALDVELPLHAVFSHPVLADLARLVAGLAGGDAQEPPLERLAAEAPEALSFAQERLWFLAQLSPDSAVYNLHAALRLRGTLDPDRLARAFRALVARHDALSTGFVTVDGQPVLRRSVSAGVELPLVRLDSLPAEARPARARELGRELVATPFDLAHPPLVRALLVQLDDDDHVWLLALHHAAADAWSLGILVRELAALYGSDGDPRVLPELPLGYADFAAWQRHRLQGERLTAELGYWRERLAGAPTRLDLPFDRPRGPRQSFAGERFSERWGADLAAGVRGLARAGEATVFMVLLAGLRALLARLTGEDDLVLGTAVAGRPRVELEGVVGLFVNSLVLRGDLAGDPSFADLVARARHDVLEAHRHQEVPFERLVDELQPRRDLAHNPLFQVLLVMQNTPAPLALPGPSTLRAEAFELDLGTARLDLTVSAIEADRELHVLTDYATDLFDRTTVQRFTRHLATLLAAAADEPRRPLSALPLLSAAERWQIEREWNETPGTEPEMALHELVFARASEAPERLAVVSDQGRWTYGELLQRAEAVARHLRALGVGPEVLVAVAAPRSFDLVAALVGILAAGGAFVPLDPEYPAERLAGMLADARPAVLLGDRATLAGLPAGARHRLAFDELPADDPTGRPDEAPRVDLDHPAYLIFTSGSTGTPHGVAVSHRAIVATLAWRRRAFALGPDEHILQNIPLSFDPSVWQIFGALVSGARLVLPPPDGHRDAAELIRLMTREGVTIADFPPSFLRVLIEEPEFPATALRRVFVGGEALPPDLRDAFRDRHQAFLHNVYGPTEAAIDAASWTFGAADRGRPVVIGRPIDGKSLHVLDVAGRTAAMGVAGQLAIGGAGLARGYLGKPGLTADRFRPDPFGAPGSRLYWTGDQVRLLPDGRLEFLSRIDQQVKVRGVRIELGEVERQLASHPAVREAVAVTAPAPSGGVQLVAFVTPAVDSPPPVAALVSHLRERLPQAMLPAAMYWRETLPRTPAGKIDRRELGREATEAPPPTAAGRPAASDRERRLAAIWAEVLGVPEVAADDNFFGIGGDSILSIRIVARANQAGFRLKARDLFEFQTVAELARQADREEAANPEPAEAPAGPVPLTPIQHWFFAQEPPEPWHFNQSVALQPAPEVTVEHFGEALDILVAHHAALRLRFRRTAGSGWQQELVPVDDPRAPAPLTRVDLTACPPDERRARVEAVETDLQRSFDLATGPLIRAVWFSAEGELPRATLLAHHLVVDAVSWSILVADLELLCRQLAAGVTEPVLPPATTSYRRWAETLQAWAAGPEAGAELDVWRRVTPASGPPTTAPLETEAETERLEVTLEPEATRSLLRESANRLKARPQELLITALVLALARRNSYSTVFLELEAHGREEDLAPGLDLSRTVGWFTAVYPVAFTVPPGSSAHEALRGVKETLRAVPRNGLGHGVLRHLADAATTTALAAGGEPTVSFNFLGHVEPDAPTTPGAHLRLVGEAFGAPRSGAFRRRHELAINTVVAGGSLHGVWTFCPSRLPRPAAEALVADFRSVLDELGRNEPAPLAHSVSDFPLIAGRQEQLDRLLRRFRQKG